MQREQEGGSLGERTASDVAETTATAITLENLKNSPQRVFTDPVAKSSAGYICKVLVFLLASRFLPTC